MTDAPEDFKKSSETNENKMQERSENRHDKKEKSHPNEQQEVKLGYSTS